MAMKAKQSTITKPVIKLRTVRELLEMTAMLKLFEDALVEQILSLPEGADRTAKEKRLSIAKGIGRALEWTLGIEGKELDQNVIGPEWEVWCSWYKQSSL